MFALAQCRIAQADAAGRALCTASVRASRSPFWTDSAALRIRVLDSHDTYIGVPSTASTATI
ncbi:MAG TPA: hypothetical protein VM555_00890, partial [Tahibacter sp.]|nr:hypothetical protein [Tahibacter sp.]